MMANAAFTNNVQKLYYTFLYNTKTVRNLWFYRFIILFGINYHKVLRYVRLKRMENPHATCAWIMS